MLKFICLVRLHLAIASDERRRKKSFSAFYGVLSLAESVTSTLSQYGKQVFLFSFKTKYFQVIY